MSVLDPDSLQYITTAGGLGVLVDGLHASSAKIWIYMGHVISFSYSSRIVRRSSSVSTFILPFFFEDATSGDWTDRLRHKSAPLPSRDPGVKIDREDK